MIKYCICQLPYLIGMGCTTYIIAYVFKYGKLPSLEVCFVLLIIALICSFIYKRSVNWFLNQQDKEN